MVTHDGPICVPVVLSGGMGTRLWPLSRKSYPKQFHNLSSDRLSLIQETLLRVAGRENFATPIVVCNENHRFLVAEKLQQIGLEDTKILLEPVAKDTAAAIAAAAVFIEREYGAKAQMLVLPSDHIIQKVDAFLEGVEQARVTARAGYLTTFGIKPDRPETGYGYIKHGQSVDGDSIFRVERFVEKPDIQRANHYLKAGNYLWNSGMFCFPVALLLRELAEHHPQIANLLPTLAEKSKVERDFTWLDAQTFKQMPEISIDYALMEKTQKAAVVPMDCGWTDAGSWEALWLLKEKDENGNVIYGEGHHYDSESCYIWAKEGPSVATLGVKDLVIISTKDCILVADKKHAQSVKKLVKQVEATNPQLVQEYRQVYRPWGHFDNIDIGAHHQVKRITVKPGESLSLQKHFHRSEHWVIVQGTADVFCNGEKKILTAGQSIYVPVTAEHRLGNPDRTEPLVLIEVQTGERLSEEDIVRLEDTYGRIVRVV